MSKYKLVPIPPETHRLVKRLAAEQDSTIIAVLVSAIEWYLQMRPLEEKLKREV